MFDISKFLGEIPQITVVDVGAMDAGGEMPFQPLVDRGLARLVGFEPILQECDRLNQTAQAGMQFFPHFIGDGGVHQFYLTTTAMSSSLYRPNTRLLNYFQNLEPYMRVSETVDVQTRRLDELPEIGNVDLLKVDVDGAEVDVFEGAAKVLKDVVVVQTEVHFIPLYQDAPLFADVDQKLRQEGFLFHQFTGNAGRAFKPLVITGQPFRGVNQWLWADAVYVKNFENFGELSAEKLLKLAVILHDVYHSYDLCALALKHYEQQSGNAVWQAYLDRLLDASPSVAA